MTSPIKTVLLLSMILVIALVTGMAVLPNSNFPGSISSEQEESNKNEVSRRWNLTPIDIAPEEKDPQRRLLREGKNRRYKNDYGESLMDQQDGETYGRIEEAIPP